MPEWCEFIQSMLSNFCVHLARFDCILRLRIVMYCGMYHDYVRLSLSDVLLAVNVCPRIYPTVKIRFFAIYLYENSLDSREGLTLMFPDCFLCRLTLSYIIIRIEEYSTSKYKMFWLWRQAILRYTSPLTYASFFSRS